MKIIYPTETGVAVIHSTGELSIEQVARKDVPEGVPYLIVPNSSIPSDRTAREAWVADFTNPTGFGIGYNAWLAEKEVTA